MDQSARRFGVPDGLVAGGLFGGALVLAALAVVGSGQIAPLAIVVALGAVVGSGVVLMRRLGSAAATLARTTHQVEEASSRLQVLVEHVPAAVYIDMADPGVTDGGRLAYMSPQVTGILGYRPDELVDDPELWPSRLHPDDRAAALAAYAEHWQTGEPLRAEYRMLARNGAEVWVRDEAYAIADDTQSGRRVSQGLLVDVTDRKRLESKLMHDALHDPLTGLANRVLFRDHLERALMRLGRTPGTVAVLFVDLDDFKRVNDSYGHAAGDTILAQVAERLAGAVRADDVVGRQSGDEFAVLLSQIRNVDEAIASADRILGELRRPIQLGAHSIAVGGSIGIALTSERGAVAEDLLTQADAAMYAAKADGKGRHEVYDPRMPVRNWTELEAAG
ncbi:MAG TPA: sensor domain-containing diguanylate cyclase [Candidatus Limnocylindrales bacterium]|nr:sensor domain-containing diguanylate cyclase [Candidatus Limnocylindrales bacterium]